MTDGKQPAKHEPILVGLVGLYLLLGAMYSFFTAKWFPWFPPQLDISMLFGKPIGIYVEAGLAFVLGSACLYAAVVMGHKHAT